MAFERGNYANTVKNSAILTGGTVIGVLIVGGMGGYALAHLEIKGANVIAFYFLVGTAIPIQLYIVPLFFLWKIFGLLNTHLGLIIIYCATSSPFATYLIRFLYGGAAERVHRGGHDRRRQQIPGHDASDLAAVLAGLSHDRTDRRLGRLE